MKTVSEKKQKQEGRREGEISLGGKQNFSFHSEISLSHCELNEHQEEKRNRIRLKIGSIAKNNSFVKGGRMIELESLSSESEVVLINFTQTHSYTGV